MNLECYIHRVGERVDSFSLNDFKAEIEKKLDEGQVSIALDLMDTKFLSIPCIKLIVAWADVLRDKGGQLVLLRPTEKLKRQISIFGSLDHLIVMKVMKTPKEKPIDESPELDGSPGF